MWVWLGWCGCACSRYTSNFNKDVNIKVGNFKVRVWGRFLAVSKTVAAFFADRNILHQSSLIEFSCSGCFDRVARVVFWWLRWCWQHHCSPSEASWSSDLITLDFFIGTNSRIYPDVRLKGTFTSWRGESWSGTLMSFNLLSIKVRHLYRKKIFLVPAGIWTHCCGTAILVIRPILLKECLEWSFIQRRPSGKQAAWAQLLGQGQLKHHDVVRISSVWLSDKI